MNWRSPWICKLGAPAATITEIVIVGLLVVGGVDLLIWAASGPYVPPTPVVPFLWLTNHPVQSAIVAFFIPSFGIVAGGCLVIAVTYIVVSSLIRWQYHKCHDYWYPEEKAAREAGELLKLIAPELP